jgi:hypothetical protein
MLEVELNDGGTRLLSGDRLFLNLGTHAAIPPIPGLEPSRPLTHIEALELDYLPAHLIVLGRLCRPRNGAGLPALRQPRDRHRDGAAADEPRGSRRRQ